MSWPSWYIRTVTPPAVEPVSLADVKAHCRIDRDDEDSLLSAFLIAARQMVENETSRALITQTVELGLDDFPRREDRIRLPRGTFQSITSFTYIDTQNNSYNMVEGLASGSPQQGRYILNQYAEPAEIVLPWGYVWPSIVLQTAAPVRIQFNCGYGNSPSTVPVAIKHAILMLVSDWYENREAEFIGRGIVSVEVKFGVDRLLSNYCLRNYTPFTR